MPFDRYNPNPVPLSLFDANLVNNLGRISLSIPLPVSLILTKASFLAAFFSTVTVIVPPESVNLIALPIRFVRTSNNLDLSPLTNSGVLSLCSKIIFNSIPLGMALFSSLTTILIFSLRSINFSFNFRVLLSILDASKISEVSRSSLLALRAIISISSFVTVISFLFFFFFELRHENICHTKQWLHWSTYFMSRHVDKLLLHLLLKFQTLV